MGNTSSASAQRRSQQSQRRRYDAGPSNENDAGTEDSCGASATVERGGSGSDAGSPRKRNRFSTLRNPFRSKETLAERARIADSGPPNSSRHARAEQSVRRRRARSMFGSGILGQESIGTSIQSPSRINTPQLGESLFRDGTSVAPSSDVEYTNRTINEEPRVDVNTNEMDGFYALAPAIHPSTQNAELQTTEVSNAISEHPPYAPLSGTVRERLSQGPSLSSLSLPRSSSSPVSRGRRLPSREQEPSQRRANRFRTSSDAQGPSRPGSIRSASSHDARARSGELVSPMPGEDQAGMLSRLLSVAAAATAASLVGHDNQQALRDAREVVVGAPVSTVPGVNTQGSIDSSSLPARDTTSDTGGSSDLVDGSFDGFLAALQSGRLAQALRNGGNVMGGGTDEVGPQQPLNFFRMFRFSNSVSIHGSPPPVEGEGRMVPIIIVGIRSVPSRQDGSTPGEGIPPFLDALGSFDGFSGENQEPASNGDVHPETRPAGPISAETTRETNIEDVATQSLLEHEPSSSHSEPSLQMTHGTSPEVRPEPTNPDEVEDFATTSEIPVRSRTENDSGIDLPDEAGNRHTTRNGTGDSRRAARPMSGLMDSVMDRLRSFRTESPDANSNDSEGTRRRRQRPPWRPFSSSGAGEESPPSSSINDAGATRSWIIYVLGGTYPENHPILTTPSLFTDSPTYEDMLLLSNLIGPAKPETAAASDIENAGPTFIITPGDKQLEERCQICLTEYEEAESCRTLTKCSHYFHRECIDEWLTTGRNNCPLCRMDTAARTQGTTEQPAAVADAVDTAVPDVQPVIQI